MNSAMMVVLLLSAQPVPAPPAAPVPSGPPPVKSVDGAAGIAAIWKDSTITWDRLRPVLAELAGSAALPASSASTGRRRSQVMVLSFQMAAIPAAPSTLLTGGGPDGTGVAGGAGAGCAERRRTTMMALFVHAVYECLTGRAALCKPRRQTRCAQRD